MNDNIIKKALDIVSRKDLVSTFGLVDEAGFPFVSAVVVIKNKGLSEFWISTSPSSRKAQIIRQNNKAGLCYHDGDNNITLAGRAELIAAPAMKEALWLEWMENFFPDGPSDSGYILIKFTTQKLRLCIDGATRTRDFTMDEIAKVLK